MKLGRIKQRLMDFRIFRGLCKYHTPERLANAIMLEAGEIGQLFQWGKIPNKDSVSDEIADVIIYCIYLSDKFNIDIEEAIFSKIEKNELKYPVDADNIKNNGWNIK